TITISARDIPIVTRQSDRFGAVKLANELKEKILSGEFKLSSPVSKFDLVQ
ncbi:MAG: methanogenesis marker 16 metalloprotein, partial [Candidatus Helarchaeota archaeon]|nr:methanogenesis marker 16 metalloprotein [Candidatus Helarchaeota archaeon]